MKKIVTLMFIVLSMVSLAGKAKDRYHFIVEGEFLSQKNVSYTIFEESKDGAFVAIEHVKARKYYFVECKVGKKYIVRFQNKQGDVKFLMIDAAKHGYFQVDVDWSKPYDGKITLEKIGYAVTPFLNIPKSALTSNN
jgi:hypothetical protein